MFELHKLKLMIFYNKIDRVEIKFKLIEYDFKDHDTTLYIKLWPWSDLSNIQIQ